MKKDQLEKEIKFYELDNPIKLRAYKNKLASYKRCLSTYIGREKLNVGDYSSSIKLSEEAIENMTEVLTYFTNKKSL